MDSQVMIIIFVICWLCISISVGVTYMFMSQETSAVGPIGPQGLKGDKGDKGDKGEKGPAGGAVSSLDNLCLGPDNNKWCFTPNPNGLHLDLRRNGATGDKDDTGEFHFSQDGNLYLNRSRQKGWIADNIRNPYLDTITFNGSPWILRQENGKHLVFRYSSNPDKRYAMFPDTYRDI